MKNSNFQFPLSNKYLQIQPKFSPIFSASTRCLKWIVSSFVGSNELRIWQTYDCFGNNWWHAYDPVTGHHTSVDSEAKMRAWIEKRYS